MEPYLITHEASGRVARINGDSVQLFKQTPKRKALNSMFAEVSLGTHEKALAAAMDWAFNAQTIKMKT